MTESGAYRATAIATPAELYSWKGIPFAAPPVGPLRFAPPAAPACTPGITDAAAFGSMCPQVDPDTGALVGSEDCLTLNVWAPTTAAAPLPVMVFIHGGANVQGSASQPVYDGAQLASRGAVLITIQYRLGALGYLAHPALAAESTQDASGNYGILDQIAALQWVQRNAAAFGGDPANVTIFGESAGGLDVCTLLASPLAAGLFHRALIESGGCVANTRAFAETSGADVADALGCSAQPDVAACLRQATTDALLTAIPAEASVLRSGPWQQHVDGWVLEETPFVALQGGRHNHVPFAIGANEDETSTSIQALTETQYQDAVTAMLGPALAPMALSLYPSSTYGSPRLAYIALTSDARFICPSRRIARAVRQSQPDPVWRYFFTHSLTGAAAPLGSFHGLELAFVFHTIGAGGMYVATADDLAVADAMSGSWVAFARTGDPNSATTPAWPAVEPGSDQHIIFAAPPTTGDNVGTEDCDFWDSLVP